MHSAILNELVDQLEQEYEKIGAQRLAMLDDLAAHVSKTLKTRREIQLAFICTHNSRRSQMAQIWAHAAAWINGIPGVASLSGGTEVTRFHPSARMAMHTLGFSFTRVDGNGDHESGPPNEHWRTAVDASGFEPLFCYSKHYEQVLHSERPFTAIMTCSHADKHCPVIPGAEARFAMYFDDPGEFDGTDNERAAYLKTAVEIGREILYVFKKARRR